MNDIKLNKPLLIKGKYYVYLDSKNKFTFVNKRQASDFLTKVSREIEQATLFATEEFSKLNEFYRLYYLTDKDFKFKFKMKESLELIENRLNWINDHGLSMNSDVYIFHGLSICFNELTESFTILMNKAAQRKDTLLKRRSALRIRIIQLYTKDLLNLGIKPVSKVAPLALIYKVS
jgi:hypothetical protein